MCRGRNGNRCRFNRIWVTAAAPASIWNWSSNWPWPVNSPAEGSPQYAPSAVVSVDHWAGEFAGAWQFVGVPVDGWCRSITGPVNSPALFVKIGRFF